MAKAHGTATHPIAKEIGLSIGLEPDADLYFYPDPDPEKESPWEVARVTLTSTNELQFSIKDEERILSATFNEEGKLTKLECSAGIPNGRTDEIAAMFCEHARDALEHLTLPH